MDYRSVGDLNGILAKSVHKVPEDVDLIVGVPRSGMLAGTLLALHTNRQLTDVDGYLNGRLMANGLQRKSIGRKVTAMSEVRRALVIDDSLLSGQEMARVRGLISEAGLAEKTIFATVFCKPGKEDQVDIAFETCSTPRVFEWNLMHGHMLPKCCVDIDGVLCVDPTNAQSDDGPKYREFLRTATPLWLPSAKIGMLVTSRLEKYRELTEAWMAEQGIEFEQLVMMQYATTAERRAAQAYGSFKAKVFAESDKVFFIESNEETAEEIARLSGKPTLCIESHRVYSASGLPHIKQSVRDAIQESQSILQRIIRKLKRIFLPGYK